MINRLKKFLCAGLIGASLIFGSAVEAGIVTDRLPLTCYCEQRVNTYSGPSGSAVGYISANVDLIQVTQVRGDGWAYGTYPTSRGRVSRWFRISDLCADVNYSNRSANVRGAQTVYRTRNGGDTLGSVSNNESVIVIADNGSRAQIVYRLDNGTGYKMGWVPSSAVPSNSSNPTRNVQAGYAMLNDGWYKISPMHATTRVLDVDAASTAEGANIQLWDNNASESQPNQVFYLRNVGNNWFTLKAGHCDKNVAAANTSGGLRTNIQLASPNPNSAAQLWRLVYSSTQGAYYIESRIRDRLAFDCADTGSGNGTNIWLWEYGDVNWNKWRFTPVRPPQNSQTSSGGLKGDVNGDGKIDNNDMDVLRKYVINLPVSINKSNADLNNDGEVDIVDLAQLGDRINAQSQNTTPQPPTVQRQAKQTVPAFTDSGLSNRTGNERVDAGDMVTILEETSGAYKVRYPTASGTKDRWVSKDIFNDPPPIPAQLQDLINRWNNQTWRDHTYLSNVKQCKEFASFIFNSLYGVGYIGGGSTSSNPKNYLINLNNPNRVGLRDYRINLTANSARELFAQAQAGDFVQIRRRHGGPHSGIFVNRTGDGIVLFEANADGRNSIRTNTYSYSDLANKNYAMSLYYAK